MASVPSVASQLPICANEASSRTGSATLARRALPERSLQAPSSAVGRPSSPAASWDEPVPSSPSTRATAHDLPPGVLVVCLMVTSTGDPSSWRKRSGKLALVRVPETSPHEQA